MLDHMLLISPGLGVMLRLTSVSILRFGLLILADVKNDQI